MQPTTGEQVARTRRHSWIALAVGIVLIAGAVLFQHERSGYGRTHDRSGNSGLLAITYGLVVQVMALMNNRELNE